MESSSAEQIQEYESQLANVTELLAASPGDESLLNLKNDIEELLALTKASLPSGEPPGVETEAPENPVAPSSLESPPDVGGEKDDAPSEARIHDTAAFAAAAEPPKPKKVKKVKDFEIPEHLQPRDTDTEAETNRKRRAVKALKSKWREKKKEVESTQKQQSWQSFQSKKKKKRSNDKSIFSTQDGVNARVGVISAGSMTEFGERKRHKHS